MCRLASCISLSELSCPVVDAAGTTSTPASPVDACSTHPASERSSVHASFSLPSTGGQLGRAGHSTDGPCCSQVGPDHHDTIARVGLGPPLRRDPLGAKRSAASRNPHVDDFAKKILVLCEIVLRSPVIDSRCWFLAYAAPAILRLRSSRVFRFTLCFFASH